MEISIDKRHKVTLNKEELSHIKTTKQYAMLVENVGFLYLRLINYSQTLPCTENEKRSLSNMARNMGYRLIDESDKTYR